MALRLVPPRVPVCDPRTGLMTREWYLFFQGMMDPNSEADELERLAMLAATAPAALPDMSDPDSDHFSVWPPAPPPIPAADDLRPPAFPPYQAPDDLTPAPRTPTPAEIGAAARGANSDIRSLSGLTTPLSVAQGGTGDAGTAWTAYTPAVAPLSGSLTTTTPKGWYRRIGTIVLLELDILIVTNGTGAGGVFVSLPFQNVRWMAMAGRESQSVGFGLCSSSEPATSSLFVQRADGTYPGGNGYRLVLTGVYETTP